ncbi:MOSC domain-containing protein [Streptomyces gilvosporeus]|uniref:MOSC domain-containing protein n=1 Tax=Streptomyces gilvosporeus TaxID=553510 RepID=A0A1V0TSY8_9ACTN|nr:MOSC domain-containing protein [Streptomyces gilvosporeus]ARF55868.1 MOSC domain-containing protein [Streptomyces gilvosporeus]
MQLLTVNLGRPAPTAHRPTGGTGIDKRPTDGPVTVTAPGPKGVGASGLAGDAVVNTRHHGGNDQAVYAYAREDLDGWERELGRELPNGAFGENLTTRGVEISGALIGERWRVGPRLLLEVTSPRIPCRTFQEWLGEPGWIKRFTRAAVPGAYLRVLEPGEIRAGDAVEAVHRPGHAVTVTLMFQALTTRPELLPRLLEAGAALHPEARAKAEKQAAGMQAARTSGAHAARTNGTQRMEGAKPVEKPA